MSQDTRRQGILTALRERVQRIAVVNDFATDAGAAVVIGEAPELGPDDPDVVIALMVQDDEIDFQGENVRTTLPIEIQVVAKADLGQPWWTIETVLGDVKRAVELADRTLNKLVSAKIERGHTRVRDREPGSMTVGIGITYRAPYLEAWGHP